MSEAAPAPGTGVDGAGMVINKVLVRWMWMNVIFRSGIVVMIFRKSAPNNRLVQLVRA